MAVLVDTNVVSELLCRSPDPVVETWMGDRPATDLYFSAVGEAELRYGVAILPVGRRQTALASVVEAVLSHAVDTVAAKFLSCRKAFDSAPIRAKVEHRDSLEILEEPQGLKTQILGEIDELDEAARGAASG